MTEGAHRLSARHPSIRRLRRLLRSRAARAAERAFVLEGETLLEEALVAGAPLEAVFTDPAGDTDLVDRARSAGVATFTAAPGVIERVAATVTPQPVLAVCGFVDVALDDVDLGSLALVCVDVRDPGNLGTVLRSAEGAGAGAVICCDASVDLYNPKCVRASAGSLFHVGVVAGGAPQEVLGALGVRGMRRLGAVSGDGTPYHEVDFSVSSAIVLGNEGHGLPPSLPDHLDGFVTIPMHGRVESLNVGMAATVLCFEAARQRAQ